MKLSQINSYLDLELNEIYQYKDHSGYDLICACTNIDKDYSTFTVLSSGGRKWIKPIVYLTDFRVKHNLTKLS